MSERSEKAGRPDTVRPVAGALLVAIAAISLAAIFFRLASPTHPLASAAWRLTLSCVLLTAIARARPAPLTRRQQRLACWGGVAYGLHFGAWVASLEMTTVAASVTVVTASPLILAFVGLVTGRDRPTRWLWLALAVSLVGLTLVGWRDLNGGSIAGLGLALVGAAAAAFYFLVARAAGEFDVWGFMAIATGVGAVGLFAVALVAGVDPLPSSWAALGYLALAALIPQLIGHALMTWSLRHTTPTRVGIATLGEPVGSTALAYVWLGEHVEALTIIGCLVTIAGVAIAVLSPKRAASPHETPGA